MIEPLPEALVPRRPTGGANLAIQLYDGPIVVTQGNSRVEEQGTVRLSWQQGTNLRFEVPDVNPRTYLELDEAQLRLEDSRAPLPAQLTSIRRRIQDGKPTLAIAGRVEATVIGEGPATTVQFLVGNFPSYIGTGVSRGASSEDSARLTLEFREWVIDLDMVEGGRDMFKEVKASGGFAATLVGRLRRSDRRGFSRESAEDVLHGLFLFLSFVAGDWSPIILPQGLDQDGNPVWERWAAPLSRPWSDRFTWFAPQKPQGLSGLFAGFMSRFTESGTVRAIGDLVQLYCHANGHVLIEPRIVLANAALELLAWMHSSEGGRAKTDSPRALLEAATQAGLGIPSEVLPNLSAYAKQRGWEDGVFAIAEMRNGLLHPGSRAKLFTAESKARVEAWQLAMYYIEVGMLCWLDYRGEFLDRLRAEHVWESTEPPWRDQAKPADSP
ncbi:MAG: hypothetical protein WEF28_09675 [Acidimicrobiia bacterium]